MTDKEAVNLYLYRQVLLAFVGAVKYHRRMVKRREADLSQVDVHARFFLGNSDAFMQNLCADRRRINRRCYRDQ